MFFFRVKSNKNGAVETNATLSLTEKRKDTSRHGERRPWMAMAYGYKFFISKSFRATATTLLFKTSLADSAVIALSVRKKETSFIAKETIITTILWLWFLFFYEDYTSRTRSVNANKLIILCIPPFFSICWLLSVGTCSRCWKTENPAGW